MTYHSDEAVFHEIGRLWPGVAGINYRRIRKIGIQWPCPTPEHPGTPYLFKGGFPRGRGRFTAVGYKPPAEVPDSEYPYVLSTGRQLFQYHTGTMTRKTSAIDTVAPGPYVEINDEDARLLAVKDGMKIRVSSRRGSIEVIARVSDRTFKGMVFIPFHYKEAAANVLTNPALDPFCSIPELKVCAVKVETF
jgi:formate dehydrogenase major subunit